MKPLAKRVPWRTTFNPDRDFVVIRGNLTTNGVTYARGDTFDKTVVTERRLRQLFDQRILHYPDEQPGALREFAKHRRRAQAPVVAAEAPTQPEPSRTRPGPRASAGVGGDKFISRNAVEIPADWRTMPWNDRRALAALLTDERVRNGPDAAAAIEAELARRGTP